MYSITNLTAFELGWVTKNSNQTNIDPFLGQSGSYQSQPNCEIHNSIVNLQQNIAHHILNSPTKRKKSWIGEVKISWPYCNLNSRKQTFCMADALLFLSVKPIFFNSLVNAFASSPRTISVPIFKLTEDDSSSPLSKSIIFSSINVWRAPPLSPWKAMKGPYCTYGTKSTNKSHPHKILNMGD